MKFSIKSIFLLLSVLLVCGKASAVEYTIDKNTWKDLHPNERVFNYFYGPAFYVLDADGNTLTMHFEKKWQYLSDDFRVATLLFLERAGAEKFAKEYESEKGRSASIKQTQMRNIFYQQFKTVGTPIQESPKIPDFIVMQSLPKFITPEFLMNSHKEFYVVSTGNKKYIPAFFIQSDAIKFQEKLKDQSGIKYDRISLDFGTLYKEMRERAKTNVPIVMFGENAESLMPEFEKELGQ